ncbi:MAG: hypothetical protein ACTSUE_27270 [Promethearchaeota archaeon]
MDASRSSTFFVFLSPLLSPFFPLFFPLFFLLFTREWTRILLEELYARLMKGAVGTAGSHASGDSARPVNPMAPVDEERTHCLLRKS